MSDLSVQLKPASEATVALMEKLGITTKPTSQAHASKLIYTEQARLANRMPTEKQVKKVAACGNSTSWIGRDLPGVRFREISFQIELLEILEAFDKAETQAGLNSAAVAMIEKVRQRLTKVRRETTYRDTAVTPEADDGEQAPF
jgi:hypothetical protein